MNEAEQVDDNEGFVMRVRDQLETLQPLSERCSIYKAPTLDRDKNDRVYTPRVVSIGPLHHGKEELRVMEEHKRRYLVEFLGWSEASLKDIVTCIRENERTLRDCYAEPIEIQGEKFVEMMLVDAAFLVCFLIKRRFLDLVKRNDRIFNKPRMIHEICLDIILMENQIPYFILIELYERSNIVERLKGCRIPFTDITYCFFKVDWDYWVADDILEVEDFSQVEHFLDFLRICLWPSKPIRVKDRKSLGTPTIVELHNAGVKIELHSSKHKLDIEFDAKMGILKIPYFKFSGCGQSETLLRNLVTYEKCLFVDCKNYVNDLIAMLGFLVKSEKDVEILHQRKIINNWLGNNQAVENLLGSIDYTMYPNKFYFSELVEGLNAYYENTWQKWKANLKNKYFNTPWAWISFAAAAFLLLLTAIQTVCSILQVL